MIDSFQPYRKTNVPLKVTNVLDNWKQKSAYFLISSTYVSV